MLGISASSLSGETFGIIWRDCSEHMTTRAGGRAKMALREKGGRSRHRREKRRVEMGHQVMLGARKRR